MLVLAVLLSAYVLVGVAPASAVWTALDMAVVRGTNNGIYWSVYNSQGWWTSWGSLGGSTLSPPGICERPYVGAVLVVVRGTDNGIYLDSWSSGSGWSGWAPPPGGGRTIDTPACGFLNSILYVIVRGTNNELYWNSYNGVTWSGWVDLNGKSASAPVLVSTPSLNRIDLFVQGMDNGTYHKAYTSGAWSISWDSPGGKTSSKPAAAFYRLVAGCASVCFETDILLLVVRGMDNNVYWNSYSNLLSTPSWGAWSSLSGKTGSAPTLAFDANYCDLGSTGDCSSIEALGVLGTDNAVYHKTYASYGWSVSWDSPGGSILNSPALAYIPGSLFQFSLVAEGVSTSLYSNTVTFNTSTWGTWVSLSGASTSDPALVAIV